MPSFARTALFRPALLLLGLFGLLPSAWAEDELTFYYLERPPFIGSNAQGEVVGVTVAPAEKALKQAGIAIRWVKMPWSRQLALLQANRSRACGTLFYKTPDRERWGRFSLPVYQDEPLVFVTRTNYELVEKRFLAVMHNKAHRFVMKERVVSVPELANALAEAKPRIIYTYYESAEMMDMLRRGLGDVILMPAEEARYLQEYLGGVEASGLKIWSLEGMPKGGQRHIVCSQSVPDEWMQRINEHLPKP